MNLVPLSAALAQDAGVPASNEPVVEEPAPPVIEDPEPPAEPAPEEDAIGDTSDTEDTGDSDEGPGDNDEFGTEFKALFAPLIAPLIAEPDVTVYIYKYIDGANGEEPATSPAPSFPMQATWNADNIGSGTSPYPLDPPSYSTQTTNMSSGADYATNEITDGNPVLPAGAECQTGKYRLAGYRVGSNQADAEKAPLSVNSPSFTDLTEDQYVIVVNEDCDNLPPPPPPTIPACNLSDDTTFDTFPLGNVNGNFGSTIWSSTGPFDQEVVDNTYGYTTFGCKSLRISNAVTSGSFGDQTFSYPVANEAGETDALNGGMSGGTRKNHFEASFDIASTMLDEQPGMVLSVAPDRGDGARMSYLRFEDQEDGIHVFFDDVQGTDNPANFVEVQIAGGSAPTPALSRTSPHRIRFSMDFVDGHSNDVVNIYIDGTLVKTGTSWENYYRFDPESNPSLISNSRTVDSLLFRVGGASADTDGEGFLFDNFSISSSDIESQSCTLVSDGTDTYVGDTPASEVTPHPAWTNAFSGDNAKWIWDAPGSPLGTVVFTRTFTSSNLGIGTLEVAADNSYSVMVNGSPVMCNGAGDNNFNSDIGTYGISGGPDTCTIPVLAATNTIEFTVNNAGGAANPDAGNPAGLYYRITVPDSTCSNVAPEQPASVTMCKMRDNPEEGEPGLSGWTLYLKGNSVQPTLSVPSTNSAGVDSNSLVAGMSYLLNAFGTWTNQGGANTVDAEYSTTDSWTTHMDGYTGYGTGILELEVNQTDTNWGPYNGSHSYSQIFSPGASGPANFRIFDGQGGVQYDGTNDTPNWFGDNSGSLSVDLNEAYSGVTGGDGCVTLENVPYGTYTAGEIAQEGWTLVGVESGAEGSEVDDGLVVVDSPTEVFNVINHENEAPTLKVHILKYLWDDGEIAPVADDSGLPEFPMTSTWQTPNLNGGEQASGSYVLGNYHGGSPVKYGADTSPMEAPADYTTSETVNGTVVVSSENECSPGKFVLLGYKSGTTLEEAEDAELSEEPIAYEDLTSDRYIIVVNKPCSEDSGQPPMCVITSDETTLEGGESSFIAEFIHESWTALIDGASWIWGDEAIVDPVGTETQTFTRGFALDSVPVTGGTLVIAADNTYSVSVNGNLVGSSADEDNYTDGAKDTIVIPAAVLIAGNNTLEITVTNLAMEGGTQETNPAGLKYKLTIDGSNCDDADPSLKVHIFKYLMDYGTASQVPNDSDAPLFPMKATYDIEGVGANLDPGDDYQLGNGGGAGGSDSGLLWAANTIPMHAGDTYGTYEVTDTESSPVVSNPESCEVGKYLLLGYKTGDTLAAAEAAEISPDSPYYENIANSKYVIVVNEDCEDVLDDGGGDEDGTGTLTIIKNTVGGDGTFQFTVDSENEDSGDAIPFSLTTNEGNGHSDSESFKLDVGGYEVTEFVPNGWNLNISCVYEENGAGIATSPQSESVTVVEGETTTCTFTNSVSGGEGSEPGTLHVMKIVDGGDGVASDFSFQVNGGEEIQFEEDGTNDVSVVAGAYEVIEVPAAGYNASYSEGCSGTMASNGEATCTITNTLTSTVGSGGGPGGGGGGGNNNNNDDGDVLGASTDEGQVLGNECTLITDFMREGMANNPAQVLLLQAFLNGEMSSGLPETGFFGSLTTQAVNSFQLKYWEEVLKPWAEIGMGEEHTPTGYVFKTTLWKINEIRCPDLDAPFPELP